MPSRTYKNKTRVWSAAFLFGVAGPLEAAAFIRNVGEPRGMISSAVVLILIVLICLQVALSRVEASPEGILVINMVIRYRVAWREIERFEIVERVTGIVCKIVRTDGGHSFISAVGERLWRPSGEGAALTAELNRELAYYTGRGLMQDPSSRPTAARGC